MSKQHTELCLQIMQVWSKIKANVEYQAEANNLTMQQVFLLHKLYENQNIYMGELAKQLHCDASNVTGIVDRLELQSLIVRKDLPEDRRVKQLHITKKGRKIIEKMLPHLADGIDFESLTDAQKASLKLTLTNLAK